ncbi:DsbA family protein [Mycolicibacterium phocaicum]|uniref:Protein-disulfide isomerase n=1 Tax=Mycolicibacterium phocaicum TaxID=319706 RepID=A0A7I7ZWF3_9MYCO|nr:thioredoxin domain-containing protein [Mycolicibacterium phocaicum]TLH63902.1 protein-disulfide isomerase [Mycolicibacterium phocaicum]BBZ57737.1 protein disulfide-isomerase [Mycolicibacterium phocaicum]SHW11692.1 protein-disulfide isomerase [Mycobacteroides abscessus subsp. abscessus]
MRLPRLILVLATALALLTASTGCGRTVTGSALRDPDLPGVTLTADGFGIIAGRPDAPAQIEVYTEPQCTHCAHLQDTDGPEMKSLITLGLLTVTYRPVTFLDTAYGYSAKVAGAMFLAAAHGTSAPALQAYVATLWGHQNPGGSAPSDGQLAGWAADAGVSAEAVATIQSGEHAVDTDEMTMTNETRLQEIRDGDAGTPTVYDLTGNAVVDIQETGWLAKLTAGRQT